MLTELTLTFCESNEPGEGIVRLDQSDMRLLGILPGDVVAVIGARTSHAKALPAYMEDRNQRLVRATGLLARNIGTAPGQKIRILSERQKPEYAENIILQVEDSLDQLYITARIKNLSTFWHERVAIEGDWLDVPTLDRHPLMVKVVSTQPAGLVQIGHGTNFTISTPPTAPDMPEMGGLRDIYRTCEALANARLVKNLTASARAVLLNGPAGCGKSQLVQRLAKALGVPLLRYDAHQLIDRQLINDGNNPEISLTEIARRGPAILLLDHLEALTWHINHPTALGVAQRTVMAHLCNVLDELPTQPQLMVFGVCAGPIDSRFRDRQRFDLFLPVDAPDRIARHEILILATRSLPLAENVDLGRLAAVTVNCTARDLEQLVTSASLLARGSLVTEQDFNASLRHLAPSVSSDVHCEVPTAPWEDVAGLDDVKQLVRETLSWSLQHQERFAAAGVKAPRSMLLSGAPGTGKTLLVRALAGITPTNFIEMSCQLLTTHDAEKGSQIIKDVFRLARRKTPCLLFFDDIDTLFNPSTALDEADHLHPVVAQLLIELDSLSLMQGVIVIAATSRPDRLSAEVMRPGHFDYAITLPMPDNSARKKILQIHARKLPLAADVDFDRLAGITHGMSPADIANLCNRAGLIALRQSLNNPDGGVIPPVVNAALFEQILRGRKS